jgi:hypothetical protein
MARQERQFQQRSGGRPVDGVGDGGWMNSQHQDKQTGSFAAFPGGVPNNPDNLRSFQQAAAGGTYARQNPYGDAFQHAVPEEPVITKANQWAGRTDADVPDMAPDALDERSDLPFGFGSGSLLNRSANTDFGAPRSFGTAPKGPKKGQRGLDLGSGRRNAPKP